VLFPLLRVTKKGAELSTFSTYELNSYLATTFFWTKGTRAWRILSTSPGVWNITPSEFDLDSEFHNMSTPLLSFPNTNLVIKTGQEDFIRKDIHVDKLSIGK